MRVEINGETHEFTTGTTLLAALETAATTRPGVAVAVNGEVVRRADWPDHVLDDGASVEVLAAVQGG
ncbi:sulfur carrier protein ThiS [Amycolatopsis suaedae]|uniref:Sulfur carrier protein ThiS n=1 Tax=Amycolatopsis suaedae TaxID=2510978 RepID=A0A4V2ELJ3_9PSEU|nr:sulfur carrier protein ThiS [Amycolatopsis suaedae]RZQ61765.1 sulfur carrier protein ThiS [Amycolatopsis suaedae]